MMSSLDQRQRAMLAEMGVRVWLPSHADTVTTPIAPNPPANPVVPPTTPAKARDTSAQDVSGLDWTQLKTAAAQCRACGLCEHRQQSVFSDIDPPSGQRTDWLIVGDAPNDAESRSGKPFAGPGLALFDAMLQAMGLQREAPGTPQETVVLVTALKCQPPTQRNPHAEEMAHCRHFLTQQIALTQPRMILAMGQMAAWAVLHDDIAGVPDIPLGKLRGQLHHAHGKPVVVTYHPEYLIRKPMDKAKAWHDLCLAMHHMRRSNPA